MRLRDVARIEMGAAGLRHARLLDNKNAVALPILQAPGANAIAAFGQRPQARWRSCKKNFPDGVDYRIVYDPTMFVRQSIEAVVHTLLEAIRWSCWW